MVILAPLLGCGNHDEPKPKATIKSDLGATFAACWTAWSQGNEPALKACYAPNPIVDSPGAGFPPATTQAAIIEAAKGFRTAFPDLAGEPQLVLVNDQKVAAVVRLTGTNDKKTPFGLIGGVVDNFDAAVITHESDYFDSLTIQGQLEGAQTVRAWNATPSLVKQTIVAKHDAAEQAKVEVVKQLVAAFNRHDLTAFGALIPDDGTWADQAERADWKKPELLADRAAGLKGFSDLAIKPQDIWGAGEFVVEIGELAGTNDGPMEGIPAPTHKPLVVPFFAVHQVVDGRVAHTWVFQQAKAFVTQLGLK